MKLYAVLISFIGLSMLSFLAVGSDYSKADKKLNDLYIMHLNKLPPKEKPKFIAAQKAWVKFKEADCKYQTILSEGGSIHAQIYGQCALAHTLNRIKDLEYYTTCTEGDLSCPFYN